jgi:hypothetical protein
MVGPILDGTKTRRSSNVMSKQLTLSIAASVLAMAAYALLGSGTAGGGLVDLGPRWSVQAEASVLPDLGQLLPTLQ